MLISAQFSENDVPKDGLSPLVRVRDLSNGSIVVNDATMSGTGDGFYVYNFSAYDSSKDYSVLCDSVTLSGSGRYTYGTSDDYDLITQIESTVTDTGVRTILIEKIQRNRLELTDGSSNNWVLYDNDNVTPLLTFSITDKDGNAILQPIGAPARRSRGT
jgi:hypothetical protein